MSDEPSLDQFVESSEPEESDEDAADPAETTHAFDADGGECESCGTSVERRWRQDGTLVCSACKRWTVEG